MNKYPQKLLMVACASLLLTACGEGWEMKLTNTTFPYGNERTAGSGIAYVRAKMMPELGANLDPIQHELSVLSEEKEEAPQEKLAQDAEAGRAEDLKVSGQIHESQKADALLKEQLKK